VRGETGVHWSLVMVAIVGSERLDPVALTLRLGADRACLFERGPPGISVCPGRCRGKRIAEVVERDPPMSDRAVWVLAQHAFECPARDREPVRMNHRNAAFELGLHLGIA